MYAVINEFPTGYNMNVWDLASQFMTRLMTVAPFSSGDFSVVMSPDAIYSDFFARFCLVDNDYRYFAFGVDNNGKNYGLTFLFQTR
jgi:hypothetical protein